ncbi:MAG TPA: hypothetical protein VMG60_08635 [Burkholderiaceae bacterium]|nr:hypothetical protein [Burkholderiaceae bacterium]
MSAAPTPVLHAGVARRLDIALRNVGTECPYHLRTNARDVDVAAIEADVDASLPAATGGEYVGTRWLASFALPAPTEEGASATP